MKKNIPIVFLITTFLLQIHVFQNAHAAVLLDRVVAVVNNEVITWSELRNVISHEGKSFLEKVPENKKEEVKKELEKDFLNSLIDMKLQLQEARKKGLDVSKAEIESAIADIKNKYNITDEKLMNSLEAESLSLEDYRAKLGEQILLSKVVNFEVKANIVINDREIGEYYEANKDKLSSKEKLKIRQIFFAAPKDNSEKPFVEVKAHEVIRRIDKGEDFSKLAGELSEDVSRQFGGDLGYISRGSVLKEVEDAALSLNVGEVSKPFWSSAGLHIIKLEDKIEAEGLDKVKDKIKEILFENAFESKYFEWKAGLKEKAYIEMKL
ncbi:MAG: peptidylprolyl isomerase [Nitrospirae bacterium]|nr:peptidylprolyl isomerase [Nitrospirota bacterium]